MKKLLCLLMSAFVLLSAKAQDDLKEYVGTYRFPDGSTIPTVDIKLDGAILIASSPAGSSPLEKLSRDTFSIVNYNGMMYFIRNAEKQVVGMKFEVQDVVQEGKKDGIDWVSGSVGQWVSHRQLFNEHPSPTRDVISVATNCRGETQIP